MPQFGRSTQPLKTIDNNISIEQVGEGTFKVRDTHFEFPVPHPSHQEPIDVSNIYSEYQFLKDNPHNCENGGVGEWKVSTQYFCVSGNDHLDVTCKNCGEKYGFSFRFVKAGNNNECMP